MKKLDAYEEEIEANFESQKTVKNFAQLRAQLMASAKAHVRNKKSITIRVAIQDLEAIKIKASKLGMPYQTYINSLIHSDASKF